MELRKVGKDVWVNPDKVVSVAARDSSQWADPESDNQTVVTLEGEYRWFVRSSVTDTALRINGVDIPFATPQDADAKTYAENNVF